ncbi:hypothetical protein AMECASPLE_027512 [Ameca splendens]|uniref:Uncharacterized protein n=1 Tax=Ameca splendens TaxID=208324 RepID=A0ABV0Y5P2_9TELE
MTTTKSRHVTSPGTAELGSHPWSQAWGQDSSESAWWLGCSSQDPTGPSPNERCEAMPSGPTTCRDRCKEDWAADKGGDLGSPIPGCLGWLKGRGMPPLDAFLGRCSRHLTPGGGPGDAGGTMSLGWPGNALGSPLEEVSEERDVWVSLLSLLPPRPGPG